MADRSGNGMPVDDDFDFDLDLTETEMLWEKKILAITDQALASGDSDMEKQSANKKDVSMNDVEDLTDDEPDLILVKDESETSRVQSESRNESESSRIKNVGQRIDSDAMEELDDSGNPKSPSILDCTDGDGGSVAARENSINALRDSLNAWRDEIDTVRDSILNNGKQEKNKNTDKINDDVKNYDLPDLDDENAVKPNGTRNIMDSLDEEKAVIVSFYDTIDLTDQSQIEMSCPGEELNTSSSGTVGEDEMNTFVISSDSEKQRSGTQASNKHSQEESKRPSSSASVGGADTYISLDLPPCQSCLKAKEKRRCTHRHHPYPPSQGQGPSSSGGQVTVGARGIGRGALLEQLTELGVKPAPKGRGILSTDWAGLGEIKKESKKLKYSVEVQHVREIFPSVHRHFVKKLLKYLSDRFSNKETILQHAVTFLSDHPYPMDGDSQWEIDAAIDSLKKVVITPTGVDIPKRKDSKSSGERDNFVSNWISQSDFQKSLDTGGPSTPSSFDTIDILDSESASTGATGDSRLFGFSNPETLTVPLGLPLVPSGTSVRSLGTSVASIVNSPPASPCSWHGSLSSSDDLFGSSPNRTTEVVGISSDTSPESVKLSTAGASLTKASNDDVLSLDSNTQKAVLDMIRTGEIVNDPSILGATGTSQTGSNELPRTSLEQKSKNSDWNSKALVESELQKAKKEMEKAKYASIHKAPIFRTPNTSRSGDNSLPGSSIDQRSSEPNWKSKERESLELQKALFASIEQGHSDMEVEEADSPGPQPKSTDSYKEQYRRALANYLRLEALKKTGRSDQSGLSKDGAGGRSPGPQPKYTDSYKEQFRRALANYKRLEALKKTGRSDQSGLDKDGAGGRSASSSSLATEGSLRLGDVRPKTSAAETLGSGTLRFHPYPQADKHLSGDKRSTSTPDFSFAVPLPGHKPDSVNHGQTVSHPDISSSIRDEDMALEEANSVVSSSSINCEKCKASQPVINLAQCCDGHLLCKICLEKAAKLILVGNQSGQVICPVIDCGSSVPKSELRKCLHSIMLDLLDEKWNKEAVDAMNEMEDFVRCPDCGYSVILDLNIKMHRCEKCKKKFCRFCSLHWEVKNHDFCIKMKTQKTADGQGVITVPAHWNITADQELPFQQVTVDETDIEFTTIAELFYATMQRNAFKVEKVYRIQNQRLWEKYMLMRTHMVADLGEMHINEQRLFHGTATEVLPAICKEGFDWRLHGRNGTAYGQGTYFAKDANYSHNYSSKHGAYKRNHSHHHHAAHHMINIMMNRQPSTIPLPFGAFPGPPPPTTQSQSIFNSSGHGFGNQQGFGSNVGNSSTNATGNQQQSSGFQFGGLGSSGSSWFKLGGHSTSNTGFSFGHSNTGNLSHQHSGPFGGTSAASASSSSGFSFGSSGASSGTTFGPGTNLTGSMDSGSDACGSFMFVGRVLVGRVCRGTPDMRRPPSSENEKEQRMCHTAVNSVHKPSIYVVFDSSQCYPEYLIEYKNRDFSY